MATSISPEIWCASSYYNCRCGYLVTEPENLDRPLAFIDVISGDAADGLEVARNICISYRREPWRAGIGVDGISVIDLTPYGHPGSIAPMPGFVYGLKCVPLDGEGKEMASTEYREPRPWCRFMVAALSKGGSVGTIDEDFKNSDLLHIQWNLSQLAERNTPDHPIAARLKPSDEDIPEKIGPELVQSTKDAIAAFWALPADEQRKVLGGWKPCPILADRQEVARDVTYGSIYRVLEMKAKAEDGRVDTVQSYVLAASALPVLVRINEGTSKADALICLFNILRMIANDYNECLIDDVPGADSMTHDTFGNLF